MIAVSYAMTSDAFADGSKVETRRFWKLATDIANRAMMLWWRRTGHKPNK